MNDVLPTLRDSGVAEKIDVPLRETILSGLFFGHRYPEAARRAAAFQTYAPPEALAAWFVHPAVLRLATNLEASRAALDRVFAAIDKTNGEQLYRILHHSP